jgi:ferredoxin
MAVSALTRTGVRRVAARGTLLAAVRRAGLPLGASCEGRGICGACRVRVPAGADALSPPDAAERDALRRLDAAPDERLACRARVADPDGDVRITTGYW